MTATGEAQRVWTHDEHERLGALLSAGHSYTDVARVLDRSVDSIKTRQRKLLRAAGKGRLQNGFWTRAEEQRMNTMLEDGQSDEAIAAALGRTVQAIRSRRPRMEAYAMVRRPQSMTRPMANVNARLSALVATIEAAKQERRPDEAYIAELRGGVLQLLEQRYGVRRRRG